MKSRYRVLSMLLFIGTVSAFLLFALFLNLTTSSTHAGESDPTKVAYLPLVFQQADLDSTPTAVPIATPDPEEFEDIEFDSLGPE